MVLQKDGANVLSEHYVMRVFYNPGLYFIAKV